MRKLAMLLAAAAAVAGIYWVSTSRAPDDRAAQTAAADGSASKRKAETAGSTSTGNRGAAPPTGFAAPASEDTAPSLTPPLDVPATAKDGFVEVSVKRAGQPVSAAEVKLYFRGAFDRGAGHADWRIAGAAKTGGDGVARLLARPGQYLASVKAERSPPARQQFTRAQGEATTRVQIDLEANGASLTGRTVQRGNQEPVALATVTVIPAFGSSGFGGRRGGRVAPRADVPAEEIAHATADAHGRFRVDNLEPGSYRVEAQAPGHAKAAAARVRVPGEAEVVLELSASGFIEGNVVAADGKPAGGAQIAAIGGGTLIASAATDQGTFSMEVDPRTYKVSAQRGREAATLDKPVAVSPGQTVRGVTLTLAPASSIDGVVVTSTGGAPIANARVTVSPYRGEGQAGGALSDAQGKFSIDLPPGSYDVATQADGFGPDMRRGVTLLASQKFPLRIDLQGVGAIEGMVKSAASGQPVPGAIVSALSVEGGRRAGPMALAMSASQPSEVRAGADGTFRLAGLSPGRARVTAHRDGSSLGDSQAVDVPEGGVARADFALKDEGVLTGRVVTKTGAPLKTAVTVRAAPMGGAMMFLGPGGMATADADASGSYRLTLPASTYNVIASPASVPGFGMPRSRNMATVEAGQTLNKDLTVDDESDSAVSGVVLEPSGEPSAGAMVRVSGNAAGNRSMMVMPADDQGRFNVSGSRAQLGALNVAASNGGRAGQAAVAAEQTQVTVQLQPAARLRGRVVAAAPVQGFRVTIAPAGRDGMGRMLGQDLEFADDKFEVDDVPPGDVSIAVRTRDGRVGDSRAALASGQTGDVEVQLKDATTVTGRVVGPDGAPVKSAMVSLADGDVIVAGMSSETTADGRFQIANVQPGEHAIRVFAPPATFKRQTFTAAAGQPLDLGDIKLDPPRADPGSIGANLRPDGDGVAVAFVLPGGPADTGGLKIGDLVTAIDGARVTSLDDARARAPGSPGSPVTFTVSRSGNAVSVPMVRAR